MLVVWFFLEAVLPVSIGLFDNGLYLMHVRLDSVQSWPLHVWVGTIIFASLGYFSQAAY